MEREKFTLKATLVDTGSKEDFLELIDNRGERAVYRIEMKGNMAIAHYGCIGARGDINYYENQPSTARLRLKDAIVAYLKSKGEFPEDMEITYKAPKRPKLPNIREGKEGVRYLRNK